MRIIELKVISVISSFVNVIKVVISEVCLKCIGS